MPPSEWRRFEAEVVRAGPNVYLREWWRVMCELDGLGWLTNGGVHMDVPPGERAPEKLLPVIGSYIDNCITPLRRLFAWGIPTAEALAAIQMHATPAGVIDVGGGTGYWAWLLRQAGVDVISVDRCPTDGRLEWHSFTGRGEKLTGKRQASEEADELPEIVNAGTKRARHREGTPENQGASGPATQQHTCAGGGMVGKECNSQHSMSLSVALPASRSSFTVTAAPFTHVEQGDAAAASRHSDRALMLCWPPKELPCAACQQQGREQDSRGLFLASDALSAYRGDVLIYVGEWEGRSGSVESLSPFGETGGPRFQQQVASSWRLVTCMPLPAFPFVRDELRIYRRRDAGTAQEVQGHGGPPSRLPPTRPTGAAAGGTDEPVTVPRRLAPLDSRSARREAGCEESYGVGGGWRWPGGGARVGAEDAWNLRRHVIAVHRKLWEVELAHSLDEAGAPEAFESDVKRLEDQLMQMRDWQASLRHPSPPRKSPKVSVP